MPKVIIDGKEYEAEPGMTIIQVCDANGIEIPRFCYHDRLSIAGNCRMCLVEVEKSPKPVASCAMPINEGMVVHTNTPVVDKARKGVMEFLLINHPLDCPICDQGGECDLQDQAVAYGAGISRYMEQKRSVPEKYMGPLIKTFMNRCIHCTRCVRFSAEIAGVEALGGVGRGEDMEITTYIEAAIASELSGNLIDVCPVGALTSKPYAFHARPWELKKVETVDVMDAVGSNIRLDVRGRVVMRVLPRLNEAINEEWISDKTRFSYDGLRVQRLDRPMIRKRGKLQPVEWDEALVYTAEKLGKIEPKKIGAIAGDLVDAESALALKLLMNKLGSPHTDCRQDEAKVDPTDRAGYLFNTTIAGIELADVCLLIGANPRLEAPLVNARLRKRYLMGGFYVASVGAPADLTYPVDELGNTVQALMDILKGKGEAAKRFKASKRPMLILGMGALRRKDGAIIQQLAKKIAETYGMIMGDWNGYNVLHTAAGRVGALEVGFVPGKNGRDARRILKAIKTGDIEAVYLLGADEINMAELGEAFVIYQGHHGDAGAHRADVVLPGVAYTEKTATYVNMEGRAQRAVMAVPPLGDAKEDWKIIRALSEAMGHTLPFDTLEEVQQALIQASPVFAHLDEVSSSTWQPSSDVEGEMDASPFAPAIANFYMTDPISRASRIMAECTQAFLNPARKAA